MWQPKNKNSAATDWVDATAKLPVAFAQVREDSAIDVELIRSLGREARVVMIASGGETAAMLSTLPIAELRLVDVNWSQLNLTRLKLQFANAQRPVGCGQFLSRLVAGVARTGSRAFW